MVQNSSKSTLVFVTLFVFCCGLVVSASHGDSFVSSVEVVNHTKFIQDKSGDLYVNLTVGILGHGFDENIKIRPTSKLGLRGTDCYKNHPMKNIDSKKHIFKQVNRLVPSTLCMEHFEFCIQAKYCL